MKRLFFTAVTAGVISVSLTAGAFATSPNAGLEKGKVVSQLEQRAQRLGQHVQTTTGAGRQEFELQQRQVKQLIERLKAGESVDPQEIDNLLRKGPQ